MQKIARLLLAISLASLTACEKGGPRVTLCLVDAVAGTMECADPDKNTFTIPIGQADNYVCMSPNDMETLLEWMALKCKK